MGLIEDIDAIYADDALTDGEKCATAAALRANGWRDALVGVGALPQTWGFNYAGASWSATLTAFTVTGGTIRIDGSVTRNGVTLTRTASGAALWPLYVTNPPVLTEQVGGSITRNGKTYMMEIIALARAIMAGVFAKAVA